MLADGDYLVKTTYVDTKYPTIILIEIPDNCAFPDCRDLKRFDTFPVNFLDLDNNGIPEYYYSFTKLTPDDLFPPTKIKTSNLSPVITYKNETIIHELTWSICYENNNSLYCQQQNIDAELNTDNDIDYFYADLRNRFDIYSITKYNISSDVDSICPLRLDLGTWPQEVIYFKKVSQMGDEMDLSVSPFLLIQNDFQGMMVTTGGKLLINNNSIVYYAGEVYGGSLILNSSNKSIIITKPSNGKLNPSPDYYFIIELLKNEHIIVSVCTHNKQEELLPSKGPNAYIFFGDNSPEKLIDLSINLEYTSQLIPNPGSIPFEFNNSKPISTPIDYLIKFSRDEIPIIEFNNTPLIETIKRSYITPEGRNMGGKVEDFEDSNIKFDYEFSSYKYNSLEPQCFSPIDPRIAGRHVVNNRTYLRINDSVFLVDSTTYCQEGIGNAGIDINSSDTRLINQHPDILQFRVKYIIKNKNVPEIIPFIFNLGKWPTIIKNKNVNQYQNLTIIGNSNFEIYGKDKTLLISEIPSSYIWYYSVDNGNVTLSVMGNKPNDFGILDIEMWVYSLNGFIENIEIIRSELTQKQQLIPRIEFNPIGMNLSQISFKYMQDGEIIEQEIFLEDGTLIFEDEPIDINGNDFYFPFYQAESIIYDVYPPVLQIKELVLPLDIDNSFSGMAYFKNNDIVFYLKPNEKVLQTFWISFISFILLLTILFFKLKQTDIVYYTTFESFIGLILIFFSSSEYLWSLGTLMFIMIFILFTILYLFRQNMQRKFAKQ